MLVWLNVLIVTAACIPVKILIIKVILTTPRILYRQLRLLIFRGYKDHLTDTSLNMLADLSRKYLLISRCYEIFWSIKIDFYSLSDLIHPPSICYRIWLSCSTISAVLRRLATGLILGFLMKMGPGRACLETWLRAYQCLIYIAYFGWKEKLLCCARRT